MALELASRNADFLRTILPSLRHQADRLRAASRHPAAAVLRRQYDALLRQVEEIEALLDVSNRETRH